jgi:hypothetical protein
VKRLALATLGLASTGMLACALLGGRAAAWIFPPLAALFPVSLVLLGAWDGCRQRGRLVFALLALLVLLEGTTLSLLVLGVGADAPRLLGLPLSAVLMGVGLALAPLVLLSWAHAATFDPPVRD